MRATTICILVLILSIVGCSSKQPQSNIIYMNDSMNNWRIAKLNECSDKVQQIVIGIFEKRIGTSEPMSREEVEYAHRYLMDQCVIHYKLDV